MTPTEQGLASVGKGIILITATILYYLIVWLATNFARPSSWLDLSPPYQYLPGLVFAGLVFATLSGYFITAKVGSRWKIRKIITPGFASASKAFAIMGIIISASTWLVESYDNAQYPELEDTIERDLKEIARDAYEYRIRSEVRQRSSAGSYRGYVLSENFAWMTLAARYRLVEVASDSIIIEGVSKHEEGSIWKAGAIRATVGPDRECRNWVYTGDFDRWPSKVKAAPYGTSYWMPVEFIKYDLIRIAEDAYQYRISSPAAERSYVGYKLRDDLRLEKTNFASYVVIETYRDSIIIEARSKKEFPPYWKAGTMRTTVGPDGKTYTWIATGDFR